MPAPLLYLPFKIPVRYDLVQPLADWLDDDESQTAFGGSSASSDDSPPSFMLPKPTYNSVQCRSELISLERVQGEDGIKRCAIVMAPEVIRTSPSPKRPFQGWRYLKPQDAPRDLSGPGAGGEELPEDLRAKLMELGAW